VLHDVGDFLLAEIQAGVAHADVGGIVFLDGSKILASFDVVPFGAFELNFPRFLFETYCKPA
ncbi:MAG: hypothetical protein J6Z12_07585, partial [Paludibacteraceae bacterium]|nr:hypothetical protein [Paludibacteraceae bacterium]